MKHFIIALLITLFTFSTAIAAEEPTSTSEELQLNTNIFAMCMLSEVSPYVNFGFSTEFALDRTFDKCEIEAKNLTVTMIMLGFTTEEQVKAGTAVKNLLIQKVDTDRNENALKRVKKFLEEQEKKEKKRDTTTSRREYPS